MQERCQERCQELCSSSKRMRDQCICVASPTKQTNKNDSSDKCTTASTSTSVFFTYDVSCFRHNSSLTSNLKVHHPAIDSLVLSLQCGKATAVFVSSSTATLSLKWKMWFQVVGFFIYVLWPSMFFTTPQSMSNTRTYEYFSKNLFTMYVAFFCSSTTLKPTR